jgi:hypothetical protein
MSDIESENENGEVSALKRKETNEPLFVATLVKTYPIVLSKSKVPSVSEKKLKALKQIKKEFEREYKHL